MVEFYPQAGCLIHLKCDGFFVHALFGALGEITARMGSIVKEVFLAGISGIALNPVRA